MDEYGYATWDENDVQEIGPSSFTMRTVLSDLVTFGFTEPGSSKSFAVPGCDPSNCIAVVVPIAAYTNGDGQHIQFEPEILNGSVRVWRGHRTAYLGLYGYGTQRLIVMRYR